MAQYPNSEVISGAGDLLLQAATAVERPIVFPYVLARSYFYPLRVLISFGNDPLSVAIGTLDRLSDRDFGALQIIFQPTKGDWGTNIRSACRNEFDPKKSSVPGQPDLVKLSDQKSETPLFAVALNVASSRLSVAENLEAFLRLFDTPDNHLERLRPSLPDDLVRDSLLRRVSYYYGMILGSAELSGLAHLPSESVLSEKLQRATARTAPAPDISEKGQIIIGENHHRETKRLVWMNGDLRNRHTYIIGSTRMGKTTLMLNMILQDMDAGRGVCVIDHHGDLIKGDILPRIPESRIGDVVYFNPDDREWPLAFNVLQSSDLRERELLCSDLVAVLQRLFRDSWGPRLEHILRYLILSLLEVRGSTLRDIRLLIDEEGFRERIVSSVRDPEVLDFWEYEFETHGNAVFAPIRNKLGKFLAYSTVRNMICQRETKLDFESAIDSQKVVLCNLSQGELGEDVSNILGALLVSRVQIAAVSKARKPKEERTDCFLYVDEFQNYITSSFEKILSEAGKYRLNLVLANQFLEQIPPRLRSAILDNVGTLVSFKVGVDVARHIEKEMGRFTAENLMSLKRGQTIVRMGSAAEAFNMTTFLPPEKPRTDFVSEIVALSRAKHATQRRIVEEEMKRPRGSKIPPQAPSDFYG